ncbi:nucleotidyltransferase domain-containing protein [Candidatus Woesearchaeota archaeon]|nr:nucleotidyltransferase domain-containing protein [Candidatus Woesearchaeota archaeon]
MDSKIESLIRSRLEKYLKDKDILDIILFGSTVKGKASPTDIDIAIITEKEIKIPGFHVSILSPKDFFIKPPSLIFTLLREGYSLKNKINFSEQFKFTNKVLFNYKLINLSPSLKVKIVRFLRGKQGFVETNKGQWLANQVFLLPINKENICEKFLLNFNVKYNKHYILIH